MKRLSRKWTGWVLVGIVIALGVALRWADLPGKVAADSTDRPSHVAPAVAPVAQPVYSLSPEGNVLKSASGSAWQRVEGFSKGRATAVVQGKEGVLYVGTESAGLFRSNDDGQSWAALTDKMGVPMPNLTVTALAVGPGGNGIYAAVGYWLGVQKAHLAPFGVYVSRDGGTVWQKMSGTMPQSPIIALEVRESDPNSVYASIEGSEAPIQFKQ